MFVPIDLVKMLTLFVRKVGFKCNKEEKKIIVRKAKVKVPAGQFPVYMAKMRNDT